MEQLAEDLSLNDMSWLNWILVILPLLFAVVVGRNMYNSIVGCKEEKLPIPTTQKKKPKVM
jgi:hypothetical protein